MSENNNKPKSNMPRFNLSWLYMFIAMTIAYLYFTSDDNAGVNKQLTYTEFKNMVNKGYASKIIAYNDNTVDMFVKPEYVKEVFKDDYKKVGRSPSMHVEIGSMDALDKFLEKAQEEGRFNGEISYEKKSDMFGAFFWNIAPIFIIVAIPIVILTYRFQRDYSVFTRRSQDLNGEISTTVEQSVQGIRVLKAFGRSKQALKNFETDALSLRNNEIRKATTLARFDMFMLALPESMLGLCLLLGLLQVNAGAMNVGQLASFFATATLVVGPTRMLGMLFGQAVQTTTALERYFEVMDTDNTIVSPTDPAPVDFANATGELVLEDVRFRFHDAPDDAQDMFQGVNLHIRPGETMALVGVTGNGKSTLLQLIPRIFDITGGQITIDGVSVHDMALDDLRRLTAFAFEDTTLFSFSVRENVLLGVDPELPEPVREDIAWEALYAADAGFVADLAHGIDTHIGEQGFSLSGGQRQRIALARAIAARPALLLLDDPLSALDTKTEERVIAQLREVLNNTTTLIIAHRSSTVALADRVALLDDGVITAVGTHQELLRSSARYRHLMASPKEDLWEVYP